MEIGVLNPAMLWGLLALSLPVIAHLLSRRKFDVVKWGAMQFLQLRKKTRRRVRLEELLLLLLRMAVIAILVYALSRPFERGLFSTPPTVSRDLVFILDGSYSMGWEGKDQTPHAAGVQWIHRTLETLKPQDTVALLDAREQVRPLVDFASTDRSFVQKRLAEIAPPSGTSNLPAAAARAMQILSTTNNVSREVVILTDSQRLPWKVDDVFQWTRFDDLRKQADINAAVWMVDLVGEDVRERVNYAVDRLELSREMTVPGFPIKIATTVHQSGGTQTRRQVYLEVNGQRLKEKTLAVNLPPNGEANVVFEHTFPVAGSHVLSVTLDGDHLPGDDRSDAAVVVSPGVPVLIVDGAPSLDPPRSESFFVRMAFLAVGKSAWVVPTTIAARDFTSKSLEGQRCVFLMNVAQLSDAQLTALHDYVAQGNGLILAPGDQVDTAAFNKLAATPAGQWLPATLGKSRVAEQLGLGPARVDSDNLEAPWLQRFRKSEKGIDLWEARFSRWWELKPMAVAAEQEASSPAPYTVMKLDNGDPFVLGRNVGKGVVLQFAGPLDGDWGTLIGRNDFVPFLHEMVFAVAASRTGRNVDVGVPLTTPIPADWPDQLAIDGPDGKPLSVEVVGKGPERVARSPATTLPGVYRLHPEGPNAAEEVFVVHSDRAESDLTGLAATDREFLGKDGRVQFAAKPADLSAKAVDRTSRNEMWWLLLLSLLALLIFETLMTRRLVRGGHAVLEPQPA
ncbi:vWA domain-containing protein [Planctomyces sp. SH-PL14]|uniref:vWA domain-containing protein n=1 Tax=Planctomyces sp. SH-PL14 TaxID=1632864 RepID=UPI00078C3656|nr:BatA and WFA domain-containing protein [Planctomyces sp. SH-PL14]AMV21899.1 hypothetical protein VT03_28615 [Planctomyces sp. SH-PL14]